LLKSRRAQPRIQLRTFVTGGTSAALDVNMERRDEQRRSARLERVKLDVAARLRRVCQSMSEVEFTSFVDRVANLKIKYLFRRTGDFFHRER
jgi:hypothetical protein